MNMKIIGAFAVAAIGLGGTAGADAQFSGLGNSIKNEAKKQKKKAERDAAREAKRALDNAVDGQTPVRVSGGSTTGGSGNGGPLGKPSASLTNYTKCAGLPLSNITIGKLGSYSFQQGFSKEKRTGFINRRPAKADACILNSGLQKDEILYFEVDESSYRKTRNGSNYTLQCVNSDNPGGGTVPIHGTNGSSDSYLGDSHMKLACGNSEGLSDCANGKNSDRASAHSADLKKRSKYGASFLARANDLSKRGQSKRLYCQFYDKNSGKSLVAFEMMSKSPYD
ncbi:hypothetical protein [Parasphingorhabdus sp.]|uniref:hypothetical protein n=1 Tax=Parasphingorhabdus sp. TaxID=2709688 RepID=UPI0007F3743C|nr:hypothetical protein A8B75_14395 [Sphingomonadales bacterium EhC05]